jgi:2-polyprenyl-3-methyl-5-hydroxy-6-metoxy-1,4-benzoquinol methylase
MARACKTQNPSVVTVAQDVTAEVAHACPWVDRYHAGEIESLADEPPFDLISLTHVIEHLADPLATLIRRSRLLAPGRKMFITAPFRAARALGPHA